MAGWFALSFLLGNEHKAEAHVVGGDGSRALCKVIAECLLFTEQDFKINHHAKLHAIPCRWRYFNLLIPAGGPQVQLEESGGC